VQIGLTPGHIYKVSLQHQGAGDARNRACGSEFWFKPEAGARYAVALQSDLDNCSIHQEQPHDATLEAFATCEQAKASGAPDEPGASTAD
jgi:hypothetical protein